MKKLVICIALVASCFSALPSIAQSPIEATPSATSEWRWVRVEPLDNAAPVKWLIQQGIAKNVAITGSQFTADLYLQEESGILDAEPSILLRGTISNKKIVTRATYIGTDADRETYRGSIRVQIPKRSLETDRITLKGDWADGFIGVTRVTNPSP